MYIVSVGVNALVLGLLVGSLFL